MRRILITNKIIGIANRYTSEMEDIHTFKTGENPKARLLNLSNRLKKSSAKIKILRQPAKKGHPAVYENKTGNKMLECSNYVKAIYDNYDGLNSLLPSQYDEKISKLVDPKLGSYELNKIKVKLPKKRLMSLFELIVEAMRYVHVQKEIIPKYIKEMGIKTCVYCNAQFATTVTLQEIKPTKKGMVRIKYHEAPCYELDHNKAKSKYPYLCTNFYNLQPSCSSCNRRKNDRELGFSLYYEPGETDISPLHFRLDPKDIIRFRMTNDGQKVLPHLCNAGSDVPPMNPEDNSDAGRFNKMLGVQGIYDEHADIVEEILWKHKIYSSGFMTATINQIKSLGIVNFDMKRFILGGYYDSDDDFLKRPLSILKNDLWDQLNRKK
ncbi:hypothetical protein prwr041_23350 [Prevotella herbatica]|uniref:HNH nuclease domain-containing protein n=1 Tax=Prevotella herbatica TaxID=2801997 RepID=A0ABM7P0Z4_9BACT|nr:hypothetical protein [Prevotella herbatica]BCS86442.1 hypothetical protein prwr041_23350 [Prevotella herbatica]